MNVHKNQVHVKLVKDVTTHMDHTDVYKHSAVQVDSK